MIQAKGMAALKAKEALVPYSFERRNPKDYDVVIDIKYSGICHSDIHMTRDEWGENSNFPMVPGHEIAGVVRTVGSKVTKYKVGDRVGVGCMVDSCRECEHCKAELEQYCIPGNTLTYGAKERDGSAVTQGGYSDVIVVNEDFVLRIPDSLPLDKAAPLLCAGITTYSPLVHWNVRPGKKVAVMGLGGLGHMAVKLAKAMGAEVTVLSQSANKKADASQLGADHFLDTKAKDVFQKNALQFDLIINTVSSADLNMAAYFGLLKLDGTLVSVGAPEKPLSVHPFPLILMRRNFAGSAIGSIKETQEMLDFCGKHNITPEIELIEPRQVNEAYARVLKSDVRYRFVIDMEKI
ncbi:NAD(P)-dependent alcohol dehydrogenase [Leptospira meyeri]|uniref:NAD(P)-dependent alcohol dehydrogenase n=1 Tax=Leptospira meyeri TaxID=29508 RepID=UPI0002BD6E62|nr:NAD(P)-dependent alcohol dehydrogenase [Leptospira meyeri]EMJ89364.1 alcohol dehydrogenase, catalytic domain, GroES-like family [Leptospira meyeri serovar Semaranga str. Veldrot Semarang 173]